MGSNRKSKLSPLSNHYTSYLCHTCVQEQKKQYQTPPRQNLDEPLPGIERNTFEFALKSNEAWAKLAGNQNPAFFEKLAVKQTPTILWLGCSDSRVPETTLLGLQPGDVFAHRNIANIVCPTDINCMAVIEYAVVHLQVKHIILCGHTCCGGANAALGDARVGGVLDAWITPLRSLRKQNEAELLILVDDGQKAVRLAELNVEMGVRNLISSWFVEEAIRKRGMTVHGVLYDVACGKIRDLGLGTERKESCPGVAAADIGEESLPSREEVGLVKGRHGILVFDGDSAALAIK